MERVPEVRGNRRGRPGTLARRGCRRGRSITRSLRPWHLGVHHGRVNVWLFWMLVALPPMLLVAAQVYVMSAQDGRDRFIVLLSGEEAAGKVALDHAVRYRLTVIEVWDASVKGYTAVVPTRRLAALRKDPRVESVELLETDELAQRWLPESHS